MPVNPPYSIIDTIARLRAGTGAAWGNAAAGVGASIGKGEENRSDRMVEAKKQSAKEAADKYHDATLFADKNFDWQHVPPAQPSSILQPAGGGAPPAPATAAPGYQPAWMKPGGANATPPAPRPAGSVTMNDIYLAHGLKPIVGGDQIMGTSKAQQKADAAQTLQGMKGAQTSDIQDKKDAASTENAKTAADAKTAAAKTAADARVKAAKIAADQRQKTAETNADAKMKAAGISAEGRKAVAKINTGLQSQDHKMQLQAMKDRDAYIMKNPASSKFFGVPAEIGTTTVPVGEHPDDAAIDAALSGGQ